MNRRQGAVLPGGAVLLLLFVALTANSQDRSHPAPSSKPVVSAAGCKPSASQLKATSIKLRGEHSDDAEFIRSLDDAFGFDTDYMTSHAAIIVGARDGLIVDLLFPYGAYRVGLMEALRKRDPIQPVTVPSGVIVDVMPGRIDSPDIIKVIVERDGKPVTPLVNGLRPKPMTTRIGAKALLHAGQIVYSCSAFAPGARVHIVAIPESGKNIDRDVAPSDLLAFSTLDDPPKRVARLAEARQNTSASLLHQSGEEVQRRLGKPDRIDGHRWSYGSGPSMLSLYLDDAQIVTGVEPKTMDLRSIKKQ